MGVSADTTLLHQDQLALALEGQKEVLGQFRLLSTAS